MKQKKIDESVRLPDYGLKSFLNIDRHTHHSCVSSPDIPSVSRTVYIDIENHLIFFAKLKHFQNEGICSGSNFTCLIIYICF